MQKNNTYTDRGSLQVRTVTAGGALPVEGAIVTVYGADTENKSLRYTVKTDQSGLTEKLELPAPPAANSRTPGYPTPFSSYHILTEREGYYVHQSLQVPVFAGITSVQTVEMIPRSYIGNPEDAPKLLDTVVESEPFQTGEDN